ncbi:MAG TPA: tetratricopeptide repeat protein [Chthoniobacterales bacterium]|nr:tetratricopeptide repeat protein [Chthoniobacterales bacterium]
MKARARAVETSSPSLSWQLCVCAIITVLIWIVFGQTLGHDFVNYDDKTYVYGNSLVAAGLSFHGLSQAFVDTQTNNWHPLTIISHMIDCQFYDLKAGGHHFTNVFLHTIATVLLFFWLCKITGAFWQSAFVTAVFAIHPLRVESVAWIAERKDVLSAVFFFLTLGAYVRYTRARSFGRYLTMSILFACGLMSKPMLVTTPVVLLLLDYWPLDRVQGAQVRGQKSKIQIWRRLVLEKLPLFMLSAGASIVAFALQVHSPASVGQLPFSWRLQNVLVSYVTYIWQMFWPANLALFYPHPDDQLALWQVALAAAFLISITWLVVALRRNHPYLLVGWFWYLIMLLPVIGIIEVGLQGHADRYTYLPHAGLYIALTWLVVDFSVSWPRRKEILAGVGTALVVTLAFCAWRQTTYWKNSETLWTHTLAVTKDNDVALTNLGTFLMERGQLDDALPYFQRALAIRSRSEHRHYSLSLALIHDSVGNVLARKGRLDDAIVHLRQAIELRPDFPDAHYNLGTALFQKGDLDGAIAEWRTTLSIHPYDAGAHTSLGNALVQKGLLGDAADHYEKALQSEPDSILPLNNLAWLMSTGPDDSLRNNEIAVQLAAKANRLSKNTNPVFMRTLAAAYAQAGQFESAIELARRAAEQANVQGIRDLANQIMEDVDLYQRRTPLRDPSLRNVQ